MDEILVKGVRILTPHEYDMLLESIKKAVQRRRFLILFWSGARYAEFKRFWEHPEWYISSRNTIHLPESATSKAKRKQVERYIHPLPDLMREIIQEFHKDPEPPSIQTWNENLKRWAEKADLSPLGLSAKSTRKSIESWMIAAGVPVHEVYLRQGHNEMTSLRHYQGLHFTSMEKEEIQRRLTGFN